VIVVFGKKKETNIIIEKDSEATKYYNKANQHTTV